MKSRLEDKYKAIELRKQGLSYKEIQAQIKVSKGLLSNWLSYLNLSPSEERSLKTLNQERILKGRVNAMMKNRARRLEREKEDLNKARALFQEFKSNPDFLIGIALYWAEGSKRTGSYQFTNSDPEMIYFMYGWTKKYLAVSKEHIKFRLFTHKIAGHEGHLPFWLKKLDLEPYYFEKTIFKPTIHALKKNPDYQGCVKMSVYSVRLLRFVSCWQKQLIEYYGKAVMRP